MNDLDKKASLFLDELYKQKGFEVIGKAPDMKFDDYDKIIKFKDLITYKVEEKARNGNYGDVLIEIMEDLKSGDLGWIYQTKAERLIYCIYSDKADEKPQEVYVFKVEELKNYLFENAKELFNKANISDKGYGLTLNVFLPKELGKRIYPN